MGGGLNITRFHDDEKKALHRYHCITLKGELKTAMSNKVY